MSWNYGVVFIEDIFGNKKKTYLYCERKRVRNKCR